MPDHPFAARLRERARSAYLGPHLSGEFDPSHPEQAPIKLTPDEADALADVVEAATALGLGYPDEELAGAHVTFHPDGGPATNWKGYTDIGDEDWARTIRAIARFRAALDRLAGRGAG